MGRVGVGQSGGRLGQVGWLVAGGGIVGWVLLRTGWRVMVATAVV